MVKRDERVIIVQHITVLLVEGADEQMMLRKPSPDDRVVQLLPARALDDEPDRDVIAGYRFFANGSNRVLMTLKVTYFGHREVEDQYDQCGITCGWSRHVARPYERKMDEQFQRSGKEGGGAASIPIAECLLTRLEPALGRVTEVEIINEKPNAVGVCWP